jgi:hypothetical protein
MREKPLSPETPTDIQPPSIFSCARSFLWVSLARPLKFPASRIKLFCCFNAPRPHRLQLQKKSAGMLAGRFYSI